MVVVRMVVIFIVVLAIVVDIARNVQGYYLLYSGNGLPGDWDTFALGQPDYEANPIYIIDFTTSMHCLPTYFVANPLAVLGFRPTCYKT